MRRAAFALRWFGAVGIVAAVVAVARFVVRDHLWNRLFGPEAVVDTDTVLAELRTFHRVSQLSDAAIALLLLTGAVLLVRATSARDGPAVDRVVAWAALGTLALHGVVRLGELVLTWAAEGAAGQPPLLARNTLVMVWLAGEAALFVGLGLVLGAARRSLRASRPRGLVLVALFAACATLFVVLAGYGFWVERPPTWIQWPQRACLLAAYVTFLLTAYWLARRQGEAAAAAGTGEPAVPAALDGSPASEGGDALRMLAWALVLRISIGVVGQVLLALAVSAKNFGAAQSWVVITTTGDTIVGAIILVALLRYLRLPEEARSSGGIAYALAGLVLGALLEMYAAAAAVELFGLAGKAARATSFWGMPSLARIEQLQATLQWGGRLALLLGVTATFGLIYSLRITACWLSDDEALARAGRVMVLAIFAGVGAMGLSLALTARLQGDEVRLLLLGGGLVLVILAGAMLFDWLGLMRQLARALDGHQAAADQAASGALDDAGAAPDSA